MKLMKELLPYIIAIYQKDGYCIVMDHYMVEHKFVYRYMLVFLNRLCYQYGCSLKERQRFVGTLLHIRQKIPVLINDRDTMLIFPTMSIHNMNCVWLVYHQIIKIKKYQYGCMVYFRGGAKLFFNMDIRSIKRQMIRCEKIVQFIS